MLGETPGQCQSREPSLHSKQLIRPRRVAAYRQRPSTSPACKVGSAGCGSGDGGAPCGNAAQALALPLPLSSPRAWPSAAGCRTRAARALRLRLPRQCFCLQRSRGEPDACVTPCRSAVPRPTASQGYANAVALKCQRLCCPPRPDHSALLCVCVCVSVELCSERSRAPSEQHGRRGRVGCSSEVECP